MLQALQKHDRVLQVTTLQKVAIKNVILSGNPVSHYIVISENDQMITQNQFPWYLLPKYMGAIHSTKIQTGPTGKRGPPQKVDQFFRNFSSWTEPIHWVLDRNFRKFWLNGSRPMYCKKYEGYKKEKFYFYLTRCIKKIIKRKSRVQRTQNQVNWVSKSFGYS